MAKKKKLRTCDAYYNAGSKEFVLENTGGRYQNLNETQFRRRLKSMGYNPNKEEGRYISEVDEQMEYTMNFHDVQYAGPLAGYMEGFCEQNGSRFLVTQSPVILPPREGDWSTIRYIMDTLFQKEVVYVHCWLKIAYEALVAQQRRPGQVLVMAGPHNCGKSLFQSIVTKITGGRSAKPYSFMSGTTEFNSDLFTAEHLMMEDEVPNTDIKSRRNFGAMIKAFTVNEEQRCRPMYKDAFMVKPFWRVTVSLNDEPENLMVLPPLDDSIEDKMIILRVHRTKMPMPTATMDQREAFWNKIESEIPAYLHELVTMNIPGSMKCERFGVKHYHDPDLIQGIDAMSPELKLLNIIDAAAISIGGWSGTASDLERELANCDTGLAKEVGSLLKYHTACGQYLGRLAKKRPDRVSVVVKGGNKRVWTITQEEHE